MFPLTFLKLLASCGCTLTKDWALIGNALSMKQRDYYCSLVLWKRIVGREDSKSFLQPLLMEGFNKRERLSMSFSVS